MKVLSSPPFAGLPRLACFHARLGLLGCCLVLPLRANSVIGAGPYYQFDVVAEVGMPLDSGVTITDAPAAITDDPIPEVFSMNDAGDLLANYRVLVEDAEHGDYTDHASALAPMEGGLLQADKRLVVKHASLGNDRTFFIGNRIFPAGGSLIVPGGYVSEELFDPFGVPKPLRPLLPMLPAVNSTGGKYFTALDFAVDWETTSPFGLYRVDSVGNPSASTLLTRLSFGPRWSIYPEADIEAGDDGSIVVNQYVSHAGQGAEFDTHEIFLLQANGTKRPIDSVPLDDPDRGLSLTTGLTRDGAFFAYVQRSAEGDAIMIGQTKATDPFAAPAKVVTTDQVIGISDDAGKTPITFASIDLECVSILRHNKGNDAVIEGDTLWVTFKAQPTMASRKNPKVTPSRPLQFHDSKGIWAVRVDIQRGSDAGLHLNASGPLPVVQVGDKFSGEEITDVQLWKAFGTGTRTRDGDPRTPGKNDHVIGFRVTTASSRMALLRGIHFDDDEDGLPNHWEELGGGIDSDRDGIADLSLQRFGADPQHKDMFLEIDWLPPRTAGFPVPWDNRPYAESLFRLIDIFAEAPVTNPDGLPGIRLHVDAGAGSDPDGIPLNFSTGEATPAELQGGDQVQPAASRLDVVTVGEGGPAAHGPFQVGTLEEIKEQYFGSADKWAREFAFRYAVLTDFMEIRTAIDLGEGGESLPTVTGVTGDVVTVSLNPPVPPAKAVTWMKDQAWMGFTGGAAAGQIRRFNHAATEAILSGGLVTGLRLHRLGPGWTPAPSAGSGLVLFGGSTGKAEGFFRNLMDPDAKPANINRLGGNDLVVSTANFFANYPTHLYIQQISRVLAHELGHTLALAHGGEDAGKAFQGNVHWSLMSYTHQLRTNGEAPLRIHDGETTFTTVPPPPGLIATTDPPGVVWSFSKGTDPMGFNEWDYARLETWSTPWHLGNSALKYRGLPVEEEGAPEYYLDALGDIEAPRLAWQLPAPPLRATLGATFAVEFSATDNAGVSTLTASFDADGNGAAAGAAEVKTPVDLGGNRYRAEFAASGAAGTRTLRIEARDAAGNVSRLEPQVLAGSGAFPDTGMPILYPIDPYSGATLPSFGSFPIRFAAFDYGSGMLRAAVRFDVNGDGSVSAAEEFPATPHPSASGEWIALIPPLSGAAGNRTMTLVATDRWLNTATYDLSLATIPPDGTPPVINVTGGPADGSTLAYGSQFLSFLISASDAGGLSRLSLTVDANGDGVIATNSSIENTIVTLFGSPTSTNGTHYLSTNFTGPGGPRLITISCTDAAGNTASVTRSVVLTDTAKPSVRLNSPGDGDPVRLGSALTVRGRVTDNAGLSSSQVSFDLNGDGAVQPAERFTPVLASDGSFTLDLPALSGPPGRRALVLAADDISGFHAETMTSVIVGNGMLGLPPATGERWRVGSSAVVGVELPGGTPAGGTVRMRFDVNGDGDTSDPGEDQSAPITVPYEPHAPLPRAVGVFGSISGPPGVRMLSVEETGVAGSAGTSAITVEGLPDAGVSQRVAHVPLTSPLLEALGDGHSAPTPVAQLGNVTFFTAITPLEGTELWRSDGTPEGTWLLRDLDPGYFEGLSGNPSGSDPAGFIVFAGKLFFTASEQAGQTFTPTIGSGRELWTSDGTVAGTTLFKDINPGRIPAQSSDSSDPEILGIFAGKLWFLANDGTNGVRLWQCDGTPGGTVPMPSSPLFVRNPEISPSGAVLGSRLLFLSNHGQDLWQTDGTLAGTSRIYQRGQPGKTVSFDKLVVADGRLYLRGGNGSAYELWTSDGTAAGTIFLKSIAPYSGDPPDLAPLGSRVVFAAETTAEGREAWVSDGTVAGTTLLRDLWPGTAPSSSTAASGHPRSFASLGDRVIFTGLSPEVGAEPWITDGTPGGTQVLADLTVTAWESRFSTTVPPGSSADHFTAGPSGAWWVANDDKRRTGAELWHWDRSSPPYLVRDLSPLAATRIFPFPTQPYYGPAGSSPLRLKLFGPRLWFRATDPIYGEELFVSDGTAAGTRRLSNLVSTHAPGSLVRTNEVVVAGFDGVHASLHFKGSGAVRVWKDAAFRPQGAPQNLIDYGGGIAFSMKVANTLGYTVQDVFRWPDGAPQPEQVASFQAVWRLAGHGGKLWMTGLGINGVQGLHHHDGAAASLVTTLYGFNPSMTLADFVADGPRVFFTVSATADRELWVADAGGARRVLSSTGVPLATVTGLTRFGGKLWFTAPNVTYNVVWTTDGTDAGTAPFRDGSLTSEWLLPERKPVVANGRLLFSAIPLIDPYPSWTTLWSTDGTAAGTVELKFEATTDPIPRTAENPRDLTVSGGKVFFSALTRLSNGADNLGEEPWITDGTAAGTRFLKNLYPRQPGDIPDSSSEPRALTPLGDGGIVFVAATPGEGRELCVSDGTAAGTYRLKVLWPGVNSPAIASMTAAGGKVWFAARTAAGGRELWSSDGTEAGTAMFEDLRPGPTGGDPRLIGAQGGKLHFLARDRGDDWAYRTVNLETTTLTDSDADGWPDEWEISFGSDPANGGSFPALQILPSNPAAGFIEARFRRPVSWSADGFEIEVEGSTDLSHWSVLGATPLGVVPAGSQEIVTVRIGLATPPPGRAFFRMRVSR